MAEFLSKANPTLFDALDERGGMSMQDGVRELDQRFADYLKSVGLFPEIASCINAIAVAGASATLQLVDDDGEPVDTWPEHLDRFRTNPNPDQSFLEFWEASLIQRGYTGETPWVGVLGNGDPEVSERTEELWVQRADRLRPLFSKTRRRAGRETPVLLGWEYDGMAGKVHLPPEAVILSKRPHPRDPIRGLSPMKELETDLNMAFASEQAFKQYMANGAFPGLAVTMDTQPLQAMRDAFEAAFTAKHAGVKNIGKAMLIWGQGAKVQRMFDAPKDALQLDVIRLVKQGIRSIYKVPPFMLADVEHANWSNSVEQQQMFYRSTVIPWNKALCDALNRSAFVPDGLRLRFDYSEVEALQPNKREQAESDAKLVAGGIRTINEIRAERGYGEPVEWGDKPTPSPLAYAYGINPFGNEVDPALAPSQPVEANTSGAEERALGFFQIVRNAHELGRKGKKGEARALRWKAFVLRSAPLERAWAKEWRGIFRDLRAEVLEEVSRVTARSGPEPTETKADIPGEMGDLFDWQEKAEEWLERVASLAARTFVRGAEDIIEEVAGESIPFPAEDPRVVEYVSGELAQKITTVSQNRLGEIRDIVANGTAEGATVADLKRTLQDHFDRQGSTWSARIARTETAGLYNRGAIAGMEDTGAEMKEWLSSRDADVRESHGAMDGTAVQLSAAFMFPSGASGPAPGMIDSAAENINCRCTVIPSFEEVPGA